MLRVWKPHSPMNLGAWTLTAYSGTAFLALAREWLRGADESELPAWGPVVDGLVVAVTDTAGVPLATLLAGYTGVLLSATATPAWSKNPWLGPLFSASAVSTGAATVSLGLEWLRDDRGRGVLEGVDTAAHLAEAVALAGYLSAAGRLAEPLTHGRQAAPFWGAVAGLAASEFLKHLAPTGDRGRWLRRAASAVGLAGSFALRWAFVHAGPPSANDPDAARWVSRDRRRRP
jgi:formate-dependent nitrite reductase membrane component NrfD